MKIKELIKRLKEVEETKPDSTVYLATERNSYDFTGLGVDIVTSLDSDVCDVVLYVVVGDKEA